MEHAPIRQRPRKEYSIALSPNLPPANVPTAGERHPKVEIAVYPKLPPRGESLLELGRHLEAWHILHPEVKSMVGLDRLLKNKLPPPAGRCICYAPGQWEHRSWVGVQSDADEEQLIQSLKEAIPPSLVRMIHSAVWEYLD